MKRNIISVQFLKTNLADGQTTRLCFLRNQEDIATQCFCFLFRMAKRSTDHRTPSMVSFLVSMLRKKRNTRSTFQFLLYYSSFILSQISIISQSYLIVSTGEGSNIHVASDWFALRLSHANAVEAVSGDVRDSWNTVFLFSIFFSFFISIFKIFIPNSLVFNFLLFCIRRDI